MQLQPPLRDEVGGTGILGHVKRVFIAHVDDGGADLDAAGARAHRRQQRKGRCKLAREVMDAKIGAVRAQFLGRHRKVDGLQQHVPGAAGQ